MKKILIIDDEQMLRQAIGNYLEDIDYEVILSGDGQEGLDLFRSEKPDAILVDLNMPKVDGFEVLEIVSQMSPETPIIVISGVGIVSEAVRSIRLGAWDFVTKPISDLEILSFTLSRALERARLLRENREYRENLEEKVRIRTIQLQKANSSLQKTQEQIVHTLARAGEYKDNETGKHVIRVSKYSEAISLALGLPELQVDLIEQVSSLHDIGKIGIPDRILMNPDRLEKSDWEEMMRHCQYGYDILSPDFEEPNETKIKLLEALNVGEDAQQSRQLLDCASTIAMYHHEKMDGTGYPTGIKGDAIPIEARVTSVADIYDALGSIRPYKESFSEEKCQSIIRDLSGSHLDATIVAAFFRSIDKILKIKHQWQD